MLSYSFEKKGNIPLYEYLYRCIKEDIVTGKLRADEKLPSKRSLAENLSVSVITVENAYAQLLSEGYIYSVEKSGYYVSLLEEVPRTGGSGDYVLPPQKAYLVDMHANTADSGHFPVAQWCRLSRKVLSEQGERLFQPCGFSGCESLRREIANYLSRNRAMNVSPDCIIIGAGTEYLCELLIRILGVDKVFGLENPGYKKVANIYETGGARCFYLNLDAKGICMQALRNSPVEVLHISPNHHFPTGIVTPASRRYELLSWAGEHSGRYIIEDDYDSELRFDSRPYGSMWAEDRNGKVIYMNTFSKTISPSLRIGYLVLPPELMELYRRKFDGFSCTVSVSEQLILAEFLASGQYDRHISRMKKFYRERRRNIMQKLSGQDLFTVREELAGLHFIMELKTDKSDAELKALAENKGIALSFLTDFLFYSDDAYSHSLVVNYSGTDEKSFSVVLDFLMEIGTLLG